MTWSATRRPPTSTKRVLDGGAGTTGIDFDTGDTAATWGTAMLHVSTDAITTRFHINRHPDLVFVIEWALANKVSITHGHVDALPQPHCESGQ